MTNEELIYYIQNGQDEYIPQLWEQVSRFISMKAGKVLEHFPTHMQDLRDDMINEAYFSMLDAVQGFDPEKGGFLTYLDYHIKNAFTKVLTGRSKRQQRDPLNSAASLDSLVDGTEDLTLADMIVDDIAEAYYRRIEDDDFWLSVNRLLDEAIGRIRDNKGRDLVRHMFYNGCNIKEASKALYGDVPVPYENYRKALKQLSDYLKYSTVRGKIEAAGLDDYIYGWGVGAWKNHRFTSAVEHVAIRHVDKQLRREDIADIIK